MKPTIFFVLDTETSCQAFPVFDIAWKAVDRHMNCYSEGSYWMPDVLDRITPIFNKPENYNQYEKEGRVTRRFFQDVKDLFNRELQGLRKNNHRVVLVAYNADFDRKALKRTAELMAGTRRSKFITRPVEWLDLWESWAISAPRHYSSKKLTESGNWKSGLEDVYKFEHYFPKQYQERHVAWSDTEDALKIFQKVIRRKKRMPIYANDEWMPGGWRALQKRCPGPGKAA